MKDRFWLPIIAVIFSVGLTFAFNFPVSKEVVTDKRVKAGAGFEEPPRLAINDKSAAYIEERLDYGQKIDPKKVVIINNDETLVSPYRILGKDAATLKELYDTGIPSEYYAYYLSTYTTNYYTIKTLLGKEIHKTTKSSESSWEYSDKDFNLETPKPNKYKLVNIRSERTWDITVKDFEEGEDE